jgi:uncharacterized membrane protein
MTQVVLDSQGQDRALEAAIARLLSVGTYASVGLLGLGVLAMIAAGVSPLDPGFPPLDLARIPSDLVALRPEGFLWLGLLAVIATPAGRVAASLVGYLAGGEVRMAAVSIAILAVIALSIALALGTEA